MLTDIVREGIPFEVKTLLKFDSGGTFCAEKNSNEAIWIASAK